MAGVVEELLVEDGATVQPGKPVLKVRVGAGGAAPKKKEESKPKETPQAAATPPPTQTQVPQTPPPPPPKQAKPLSSTPIQSIKTPAPTSESGVSPGARKENRVKMNRMRLRIAQRLKDAQNTYAMLTTFNEIDMRSDHSLHFQRLY